MVEDRDPKEPIKVTDRRSFTKDGRRRDAEGESETETRPPSRGEPEVPREVIGDGFTMETPLHADESAASQDAAFLNLIVSIYQSGCIHLGLAEGEEASKEALDFEAARGTIEMLLALKRKTLGNLSTDEGRILETLLAELQMTYALKVSDA
jgi:hypothetical protein